MVMASCRSPGRQRGRHGSRAGSVRPGSVRPGGGRGKHAPSSGRVRGGGRPRAGRGIGSLVV